MNNILVYVVFAILAFGTGLAAISKDDEQLQKKLVIDSVIATLFALGFMPLAWLAVDLPLQWFRNIGFLFLPTYPIHVLLSPLAVTSTLAVYAWYAIRLRWPTKHPKPNERASKRPSYVSVVNIPLVPFGLH